ncbi:hypothetical protein ATY41_00775 [Leifsonia xyli subsp. xyli]|uniref:Uncharacterized protein n=1 Tax=Leifsonia xyli subsp. xyli TaxID=59736 RepID=A0A1E2SNS8_LEIXY|nr:hypothetical protein ATY41_00775 [Leifsonia xyli subsp. xyli]
MRLPWLRSQPDGDELPAHPADLFEFHSLAQRLRPDRAGRGEPGLRVRGDDSVDEVVEVGRAVCCGRRAAERDRNTEIVQELHLDGLGCLLLRASGDEGRLHRRDVVLPELDVGPARLRAADGGGGRDADDVRGVLPALHAQGDPEVRVGQDVLGDHPRGALGREDHVDAERPADRADADEGGENVRKVLREHRELVDDEQQPRKRFGRVRREVGVEVVDIVARGGEQALPALHLGLERAQGAVGELLVEIADRADGVREALARFERGAAFEVDQDEVQPGGIVPVREAGDEGAEELALAGARRAADESVRPVLDQIEGEDSAADQDGGRPGEQLALRVDAAAVDDGAVRRTAVADSHPVALERQSAVAPGGALGAERHIRLRGAPDHELAAVRDGHDAADGLAAGERDAPSRHPGERAARLRGDERPLQEDEVAQFGRRRHGDAVHEEPLLRLQPATACRVHELGDSRRRSPPAQLDRLAPAVDVDHHPHSGLPWSYRA